MCAGHPQRVYIAKEDSEKRDNIKRKSYSQSLKKWVQIPENPEIQKGKDKRKFYSQEKRRWILPSEDPDIWKNEVGLPGSLLIKIASEEQS